MVVGKWSKIYGIPISSDTQISPPPPRPCSSKTARNTFDKSAHPGNQCAKFETGGCDIRPVRVRGKAKCQGQGVTVLEPCQHCVNVTLICARSICQRVAFRIWMVFCLARWSCRHCNTLATNIATNHQTPRHSVTYKNRSLQSVTLGKKLYKYV